MEQHNLSLAKNRNPVLAMSIDKRAIVIRLDGIKAFADVGMDCNMYLFKWNEVAETRDAAYEKEEIENFVGQCKTHEQKLIGLLDMLRLPI